jgi:hypothetical protein
VADVTILCDFVHVLENVWKAAWSFHREGDAAQRGSSGATVSGITSPAVSPFDSHRSERPAHLRQCFG